MRDLILVGAGLANGLIAWRVKQRWPTLDILLIESGPAAGGNHTWSFHHDDLSPAQHAWIAPLVAHAWQGYDVHFPDFTRHLPGAYYSVTSTHFAACLADAMGDDLWLNTEVSALAPDSVTLANGERITARAVIDGRGMQPEPHLRTGYQVFLGQEWQLDAPHGLTSPIIMDATVAQTQGYRFVYTLPLAQDRLLIEDTRYADQPQLALPALRQTIAQYAAAKNWSLRHRVREENGCLPITLSGDIHAFWQSAKAQPRAGLRAGLFHPTTGYSLPQAAELADRISARVPFNSADLYALTRGLSMQNWRAQGYFRLLNRMLFLAGKSENRWRVMQRFYTLPDATIARFYAGKLTWRDKARILTGKPPVPPGEALRAAFDTSPTR